MRKEYSKKRKEEAERRRRGSRAKFRCSEKTRSPGWRFVSEMSARREGRNVDGDTLPRKQ